jgi:hypothetical protein
VGDRSLLARIDVGPFASPEEKSGHVSRQEGPCLRVHHIEAVVVDQHRLLFAPVCPALPTDLSHDTGADLPRERSLLESFARLPAPRTAYCGHDELRAGVLDLRQPEEREQPQIHPSYVELVPLHLELGRTRVVVVVVV